MSLNNGIYIIQSKVSNGAHIGRFMIEDLSLLPKRIHALPQGIQAPHLIIHKLDNGKYTIKAGGAPTGVVDGRLFALLIDIHPATEWKIESSGGNVYEISDGAGNYWTVPSDDGDSRGPHVSVGQKRGDASQFILVQIDRE